MVEENEERLVVGITKRGLRSYLMASLAFCAFSYVWLTLVGFRITMLPQMLRGHSWTLLFLLFPLLGMLGIIRYAKTLWMGETFTFDQQSRYIFHNAKRLLSFDAVKEIRVLSPIFHPGVPVVWLVSKQDKQWLILDARFLRAEWSAQQMLKSQDKKRQEVSSAAIKIAQYIGVSISNECIPKTRSTRAT